MTGKTGQADNAKTVAGIGVDSFKDFSAKHNITTGEERQKYWDVFAGLLWVRLNQYFGKDVMDSVRDYFLNLDKQFQAKTTEPMQATGGKQFNANEGPGSEGVKESTKGDLIAIISEFVVPLGRDIGPGTIKLSRNETQNIWQAVNLLNDKRIEILLPQQVKLTETMKEALSDIRKRKGADVVKTEEYSSVEHLAKLLGQKTAPGLKRIVLTEKGMSSQMKQLAETRPELFNGNRLLNIALPDSYTAMNAKEKTFYQARMVMTAILARLYERDRTPMVELILTDMLTGCVDTEDGSIGKFLNKLAESDSESSNPNQVKERILYCLDKTVSLIAKLAEAMEHVRLMMKEFWTAA